MFTLDDPMLALIIRFVTNPNELSTSDEEFMKIQLETLRKHLAKFPEEDKRQRALEWINSHAESYRSNWHRQALSKQLNRKRCKDCPMQGYENTHCVVHDRWLKLLNRYLADRITSERYVYEALQLLQQHKTELRVATAEHTLHTHLKLDYHTES